MLGGPIFGGPIWRPLRQGGIPQGAYPPPRLCVRRLQSFAVRRPTFTLLTYSQRLPFHWTNFPQGPEILSWRLATASPPWVKKHLNPYENFLKPLQMRSEPPKTFQNPLKTTKTLGTHHQGPSWSSPGRLPDFQKSIFSFSGPLKINTFANRTSKIRYFRSPDF